MTSDEVRAWAKAARFEIETEQSGQMHRARLTRLPNTLSTPYEDKAGNAVRSLGEMVRLIQAAPKL